jgi:hypothetical protein
MVKRMLAAAAVAVPAFLVGGVPGAPPAAAETSAPCTVTDRGPAAASETTQVRCEWRKRYGDWCKYCYRYGKWRLQYCDDDWDDWNDWDD